MTAMSKYHMTSFWNRGFEKLLTNGLRKFLAPCCKACLHPISADGPALLLLRHTKADPQQRCSSREEATLKATLSGLEDNSSLPTAHATLLWAPESGTLETDACQELELYHPTCLKCVQCGEKLTQVDRRCWKNKNSAVICQKCRERLTHCARCRLKVARDAWVHKLDKIPFHVACLACDKCGHQLSPGEKCGVRDDRIYCMEHYLMQFNGSDVKREAVEKPIDSSWLGSWRGSYVTSDSTGPTLSEDTEIGVIRSQHHDSRGYTNSPDETEQTEDDRKHNKFLDTQVSDITVQFRSTNHEEHTEDPGLPSTNYSRVSSLPTTIAVASKSDDLTRESWYATDDSVVTSEDPFALPTSSIVIGQPIDCSSLTAEQGILSAESRSSSASSAHSKSKRIRTSFTPDQLTILQANFDIEANPDGQELERIANMARLNKRVTQVWFQNARARKKKIECKGFPGSGSLNSVHCDSYCLHDGGSTNTEEFYEDCDEATSGAYDLLPMYEQFNGFCFESTLSFKPAEHLGLSPQFPFTRPRSPFGPLGLPQLTHNSALPRTGQRGICCADGIPHRVHSPLNHIIIANTKVPDSKSID
ncbi:unnamed protein product [Dicrocoelium dendriticum]|nr:unnamed protein product [Dicrocoelium dendriticum]